MTSASNLRKNIKIIHKIHKDYKCDSCGKSFTSVNFVNDLMCSLRLLAYVNNHWHQSALNSAGALQGGDGEFQGTFTPFYTINFRGGRKSSGARATVASPSLAPLKIGQEGHNIF